MKVIRPKKNKSNKVKQQIEAVKRATHTTLDRYSKTFKDLARYDREHKATN